MSEVTWDAVAKVATMERVLAANGSPSDITTPIEESVRVALATELRRFGAKFQKSGEALKASHETAKSNDIRTVLRSKWGTYSYVAGKLFAEADELHVLHAAGVHTEKGEE